MPSLRDPRNRGQLAPDPLGDCFSVNGSMSPETVMSTTCARFVSSRMIGFSVQIGNVVIPSILLLTSSTTRRRVGAAVELDHHHAHPLRRGRLDLLDAVDARTASSIQTFTAASTPPGRRYGTGPRR